MYDYIVVGGGSAGCVMARRLSDQPDVKVLLLEAGKRDWHPFIHMPAGFAKLTGTLANWGYSTVPQRHLDGREVWYPQGEILGGSSDSGANGKGKGVYRGYNRKLSE